MMIILLLMMIVVMKMAVVVFTIPSFLLINGIVQNGRLK
jgi:hypothetical protein